MKEQLPVDSADTAEPTPRRPGRRAWQLLAPTLAIALLAVAGCSSGAAATGGASGSGGGSGGGTQDAARQAYTQCLSENGVTMPSPPSGGAGGAGADDPAGQTPPSGAPPAGTGGAGPGGPGGAGQAPPGVDAETWQAARQACASFAPSPPDDQAAPAA